MEGFRMDRVQLKNMAKAQIKSNIWMLLLISIIIGAITGLLNIVLPPLGSVASLLAASAFSLATVKIYLRLSDGIKPEVEDTFATIKEFWPAFKVTFFTGLFTFLWSLLLFIPGIIKMYSYSMAMYILAENPNIGALDALKQSENMMKGHKMEMFILDLSFIGWYLLVSVTGGIASIWVTPYITATKTNFYNSIK